MINIDIKKVDNVLWMKCGSTSDIYGCVYKGKVYIYKKYLEPDKTFDSNFNNRLDFLSRERFSQSLLPKYMVFENDEKVGYLTPKIDNKNILRIEDPIVKYHALQSAKKAIEEIHRKDIIHGDIHPGNILVRNDKRCLIDFDNCDVTTTDRINMDFERCSMPAMEFINRNGIIKNLDIYMFNILTFFSFNKLSSSGYIGDMFDTARSSIYFGKYGIFNKSDSRRICEDMYLSDKYLLDTISERDVDKYEKKLIYK